MLKTSFYNEAELKELGLKSFGKKVLISRYARIYNAFNIEVGDDVRIDDFCILSGHIKLGSHIHIAAGVYLFAGSAGIEMEDFTCLSGRCTVYAVSDDYSGETMANAVIFDKYKSVVEKKVLIKKRALIGTGSIVLPGVTVQTGCAVGANSLLLKSTDPWSIYVGSPAKKIKSRQRDLLILEKEFLKEWNSKND
jgi:galactoside O-acetyltransferase